MRRILTRWAGWEQVVGRHTHVQQGDVICLRKFPPSLFVGYDDFNAMVCFATGERGGYEIGNEFHGEYLYVCSTRTAAGKRGYCWRPAKRMFPTTSRLRLPMNPKYSKQLPIP